MNKNYAVVRETCPICGQGQLLIAIAESIPKDFFILCEDCESEWSSIEDVDDIEMATRDTHKFLRYANIEDLASHLWQKLILNK